MANEELINFNRVREKIRASFITAIIKAKYGMKAPQLPKEPKRLKLTKDRTKTQPSQALQN